MAEQAVLEIYDKDSVVRTRQAGRAFAKRLGFGSADQTRLATAISELVRNVLQHGGGSGTCRIEDISDSDRVKLRVIVEDRGPGIADVELAMQDGFTTAGSLGAGLPGAKRLVQKFDLKSEPGHTTVTIEVARRRR